MDHKRGARGTDGTPRLGEAGMAAKKVETDPFVPPMLQRSTTLLMYTAQLVENQRPGAERYAVGAETLARRRGLRGGR